MSWSAPCTKEIQPPNRVLLTTLLGGQSCREPAGVRLKPAESRLQAESTAPHEASPGIGIAENVLGRNRRRDPSGNRTVPTRSARKFKTGHYRPVATLRT